MPALLLLLLFVLACAGSQDAGSSPPDAERTAGTELAAIRESMAAHQVELDVEASKLSEVKAQQAADQLRMDELEKLVSNLGSVWDEVIEDYRLAASAYKRAAESYEASRGAASESAKAHEAARAEWERAATSWKFAALMIAAATAIETHRLNDGSLGKVARESDLGCDQRMSRQSYRRKFDVASGMEVDHIVPRSLGGADHPLNYQLLTQHENRSWSNRFNAAKCVSAGVAQCAVAVAVSIRCGGYQGGIPAN